MTRPRLGAPCAVRDAAARLSPFVTPFTPAVPALMGGGCLIDVGVPCHAGLGEMRLSPEGKIAYPSGKSYSGLGEKLPWVEGKLYLQPKSI